MMISGEHPVSSFFAYLGFRLERGMIAVFASNVTTRKIQARTRIHLATF